MRSITRFNLYILYLIILLLLHLFVCLPQHHQTSSDQFIQNHRCHFAPSSHVGLSFFSIFGLRVVLNISYFTIIVIGISSPLFGIGDLLYLTFSPSRTQQFKIQRSSLERDPHIIRCQCVLQRGGYGDCKLNRGHSGSTWRLTSILRLQIDRYTCSTQANPREAHLISI